MAIGIKDVFKLAGMIMISACAVFVSALFLNYNIDLQSIEAQVNSAEASALFEALKMTGGVVSAVSGGCLLLTSAVMLAFYIKHFIDSRRRELGILKALGYSNLSIAVGFWIFGLSVLFGAAIGFSAAHLIMPGFYAGQNEDGLLPQFEPHFHFELLVFLVLLPAGVFALLSVIYSLLKMKTPVIELLKGRSGGKVRSVKTNGNLPFLKELRKIIVGSRRSLVFFIGFAAFCYSAMVQMSLGMDELASGTISLMTLLIGIALALTTLFIAVSAVVGSNAKSVSIMRVFGYSGKECSSAVLNGYRPAALIGFGAGTFYQYFLLRIAVDVVFADVENVPDFGFSFRALIIAAVSFAAVYETVMRFCSRRIGKISVKEIMLDRE